MTLAPANLDHLTQREHPSRGKGKERATDKHRNRWLRTRLSLIGPKSCALNGDS